MNLDHMAQAAVERFHEYEEKQRQEAEAKRRDLELEAEQLLRQQLSEHLSPEFLESLELHFAHSYDHYSKQHSVSAAFPYMEWDWHIGKRNVGDWSIWTSHHKANSVYDNKASGVSAAHLQTRLLIEIGKHREAVRKAEAERAERIRQSDYQREQQAKVVERQAKELNHRIDAADSEDARLRQVVADARAKEQREMWRWLEGVTIEIYHVQWCTGSYRDDDREMQFDYDSGWTSASHLDEHDRIRIEKQRRYGDSGPRTVQLIPDVHKPVWTVHRFSSVEELPEQLQAPVTAKVQYIATRRDSSLDGKTRLFETRELGYSEDWYSEDIGWQPLRWIRDLVVKEVLEA